MAEEEYQIRNKHMLLLAGGLGVLAVLLVLWNEHRIRRESDEAMVDIVIASRTLTPGKKITLEDVYISRFPLRLVPEEFHGDIIMGQERNSLMDFELNQEVLVGRIMRWSYLHGGGPRGSIGPTVPQEGNRIIGIAVDRHRCPPEVRIGSWVDIMYNSESGDTDWVMRRVLIKTINATGAVGSPTRNVESVGVEVSKEHAPRLSSFLERNRARIVLWLVNEAESVPPEERGINPKLR